MGKKLGIKLLQFFGLFVFALQLADAPAIAADVASPKYRICPHTKAQYKRGNPCPCGHKHGKNRDIARFVSEHGDCDGDDDGDRARAPGFETLVFTFNRECLPMKDRCSFLHIPLLFVYSGLSVDPPDTPS